MIEYQINPNIANEALNALFADAWPNHTPCDFSSVPSRSPGHVCAISEAIPVGFASVAWDNGAHAFLLSPTVRSDSRRHGIGTRLVRHAVDLARSKGVEWLHVDYEPRYAEFYLKCGFRYTKASFINLRDEEHRTSPLT